MPVYAVTYPLPPSSTSALPALSSSGGTHNSRSKPVVMNMSALRSCSAKLGLGRTKCESSLGSAIEVTCTSSPPMDLATDA